ncbi:hypothetical protein HDV00_000595 [Rhizophlyctis rosea]|nr:hypothetical protein HDV00_000595 [Rhizophlyctis rosea]
MADPVASEAEESPKPKYEDLPTLLKDVIFVLVNEVDEKVFPTAQPHPLGSLKERVESGSHYTSLAQFHDDFDITIRTLLRQYPRSYPSHAEADRIWQFGTRLLNNLYERVEKKDGVEPHKSLKRPRKQRVALAQQSSDYNDYFTSADFAFDDVALDTAPLRKILLAPIPSRTIKSQTLSTLLLAKDYKVRRRPYEKVKAVQLPEFFEYGAFTSFAPISDSSRSRLSLAETMTIARGRRTLVIEESSPPPEMSDVPIYRGEAPSPPPTPMNVDVDESLFEDAGIDVKSVLEGAKKCKEEEAWSGILVENVDLFRRLKGLQDGRIKKGITEIGKEEMRVARDLLRNLTRLTSMSTPSNLITPEAIQSAIKSLRLYDPSYQGALPSGKATTFASNRISAPAPPIASTGVPTAGYGADIYGADTGRADRGEKRRRGDDYSYSSGRAAPSGGGVGSYYPYGNPSGGDMYASASAPAASFRDLIGGGAGGGTAGRGVGVGTSAAAQALAAQQQAYEAAFGAAVGAYMMGNAGAGGMGSPAPGSVVGAGASGGGVGTGGGTAATQAHAQAFWNSMTAAAQAMGVGVGGAGAGSGGSGGGSIASGLSSLTNPYAAWYFGGGGAGTPGGGGVGAVTGNGYGTGMRSGAGVSGGVGTTGSAGGVNTTPAATGGGSGAYASGTNNMQAQMYDWKIETGISKRR